jgi:hypothetical protein
MSENGKEQAQAQPGIKVLRERCGGMSEDFKRYYQQQISVLKALREALKSGPLTVPELAVACKLDKPVVMWHLMALRRYGEVIEDGEAGSYLKYTLKEAGR